MCSIALICNLQPFAMLFMIIHTHHKNWITNWAVICVCRAFLFSVCFCRSVCECRCWFQMRDAIIKGAHPVTQDEALEFAGYQCQIQFGSHVESKHKSGFLEWVGGHRVGCSVGAWGHAGGVGLGGGGGADRARLKLNVWNWEIRFIYNLQLIVTC